MGDQRTARCRLVAAGLALSACLAISSCVPPDIRELVTISPNVSTLAPGESVEFLLSATLDGDPWPILTSIWDATGGSFSSTTTNPTTYTAPMEEGVYEITVEFTTSTVGEPGFRSRTITVVAPEEEEGITIIWTGNASSDWFDPQNWDPEQVPSANDTVEIPEDSDNIVITWRDDQPTVTVRELNQHGGTLRIGGADNCPNCRRLVVRGSVNAGSALARIELERGDLLIGDDSAIHTLAGVWPAAEPGEYAEHPGSGGGQVWSLYSYPPLDGGNATPTLEVAVQDGFVIYTDLNVTITQGGRWVWGTGMSTADDENTTASITIAREAVVQLVGGENAIGERGVGGAPNGRASLHVHGRLYSLDQTSEWIFTIPVFVEPNGAGSDPGEVEIPRFRSGRELQSYGRITASQSLYLTDSADHPGVTLHPDSRTEAGFAEWSVFTTISGEFISDHLRVGGGSDGRLTVTDAGLLQVGTLTMQGLHPVTIHVPTALTGPGAPIGLLTGAPNLRLHGPHPLVVDEINVSNATIAGETSGATLSTTTANIVSSLIDDATVEIHGTGDLRPGAAMSLRGRAQARLRIEAGGTLRFHGGNAGPDPAPGVGGALHFDHFGAVQAWSGQSSLTACITTGPGAAVLPPNHVLAELTLANECP